MTENEFNEAFKDLIDKSNGKCNKNKDIIVRLPSSLSKCVGGLEMLQRLYLEFVLQSPMRLMNNDNNNNDNSNDNKKNEIDSSKYFQIDIVDIEESHGDNWCFDCSCMILMADGHSRKRICDLKIGDKVLSFPNKISIIDHCIHTNPNCNIPMVQVNTQCWITFEHPILVCNNSNITNNNNDCSDNVVSTNINSDICSQMQRDGINELNSFDIEKYNVCWMFPYDYQPIKWRYQKEVHNLVLDSNHTINVNGVWCCTLGHDFRGKVIEHPFWGNSKAIRNHLSLQCHNALP